MKAIAKFFHPQVFDEVKDLNFLVSNLEGQVEDGMQQVSALGSKIIELEQKLSDANNQIVDMTAKYENLMTDYNSEIENHAHLRCQYDTLEEELVSEQQLDAKAIRARYDEVMEDEPSPWSIFEVLGFDDQGVKVNFNWNRHFIMEINKMGFVGDTDEECVEKFFALMKMLPTGFFDSPDSNV